ncbi:MAG: hypothetical protein ACT4OK_03090 [Gemmobacter sp.]
MDRAIDPERLQRACADAVQRTEAICASLVARFRAAVTPEFVQTQRFLYYCSVGSERDPDDIFREGPIKYAAFFRRYLDEKLPMLPTMAPLAGRRVYEIGVGAGYMLYLLREVLGCDVYGCDIHAKTHEVYRPLRAALGVQDVTHDRAVVSGQPVGIAPGTEAVIATWPAFMKHRGPALPSEDMEGDDESNWTLQDHQWFVNHCSDHLTGARQVVLRFNRQGFVKDRAVREFYHDIGTFPLREDRRFCVIAL